jgi:hypothetical protein
LLHRAGAFQDRENRTYKDGTLPSRDDPSSRAACAPERPDPSLRPALHKPARLLVEATHTSSLLGFAPQARRASRPCLLRVTPRCRDHAPGTRCDPVGRSSAAWSHRRRPTRDEPIRPPIRGRCQSTPARSVGCTDRTRAAFGSTSGAGRLILPGNIAACTLIDPARPISGIARKTRGLVAVGQADLRCMGRWAPHMGTERRRKRPAELVAVVYLRLAWCASTLPKASSSCVVIRCLNSASSASEASGRSELTAPMISSQRSSG